MVEMTELGEWPDHVVAYRYAAEILEFGYVFAHCMFDPHLSLFCGKW
jgi:hypothetical protein